MGYIYLFEPSHSIDNPELDMLTQSYLDLAFDVFRAAHNIGTGFVVNPRHPVVFSGAIMKDALTYLVRAKDVVLSETSTNIPVGSLPFGYPVQRYVLGKGVYLHNIEIGMNIRDELIRVLIPSDSHNPTLPVPSIWAGNLLEYQITDGLDAVRIITKMKLLMISQGFDFIRWGNMDFVVFPDAEWIPEHLRGITLQWEHGKGLSASDFEGVRGFLTTLMVISDLFVLKQDMKKKANFIGPQLGVVLQSSAHPEMAFSNQGLNLVYGLMQRRNYVSIVPGSLVDTNAETSCRFVLNYRQMLTSRINNLGDLPPIANIFLDMSYDKTSKIVTVSTAIAGITVRLGTYHDMGLVEEHLMKFFDSLQTHGHLDFRPITFGFDAVSRQFIFDIESVRIPGLHMTGRVDLATGRISVGSLINNGAPVACSFSVAATTKAFTVE
ncbi:MAG: hypothetical protein Q6353_001400, partial [Candidatus Sigynarchaeum springense]